MGPCVMDDRYRVGRDTERFQLFKRTFIAGTIVNRIFIASLYFFDCTFLYRV